KIPVLPEVMIPLVGHVKELQNQERLVRATADAVMKEQGVKFDYLVGTMIEIGIRRGRKTKPRLKVGICGEHGGEPSSIEFCHLIGQNYVSCSPFRVPIARLAAARAAILNAPKPAAKKSAKKPAKKAPRKR
ncbi:MAG: putative PEP-binding protein, partial [Candidatus Aminicenantales bacterium]